MYYSAAQLGSNPCSENRSLCPHLCFGISAAKYVCKCAIGYFEDPTNRSRCLGKDEFILYSVSHELRGLNLLDTATTGQGQQMKVMIRRLSFENENFNFFSFCAGSWTNIENIIGIKH